VIPHPDPYEQIRRCESPSLPASLVGIILAQIGVAFALVRVWK